MQLAVRVFMAVALVTACSPQAPRSAACVEPDKAQVGASDPGLRPRYHFTPPTGWMNDPAGLVWQAGEYHLFFQRDPHDVFTSDVRWGHAVSADLLHWQDLPDALTPDEGLGVPFTGSAVVDPQDTSGLCAGHVDCLIALFTHAFGTSNSQKQSLAVSTDHGRTWALDPQNPVLTANLADFRDPFVRWHAATAEWVMVLGTTGAALFYASPDLHHWTQTGAFALPPTVAGAVECPTLLPLTAPDGSTHWLLKVDVNPGLLQSGKSLYWLGQFDGQAFTPQTDKNGLRLDGPDFYAAQAFANAPEGRAIWLGWMSDWSYAMFTPPVGYRGQQSVPRQLGLAQTPGGLRLTQAPVAELATLEAACPLVAQAAVAVGQDVTLQAQLDDAYVLRLTLEPAGASEVGVRVLQGAVDRTSVGYDATHGTLFVDRGVPPGSDLPASFGGRQEVPVALVDGGLTLTVYVDRTSVEVFAAGGLAVLSVSVYPTESAHGLAAFATGGTGTLRDVSVHRLARAMRAE